MNKLYLVDDQPIANFIARKLIELEGFHGEIKEFINPVEALKDIKKEAGVIIFLDLNMPEMNGWEFLEVLKKRKICHYIIILTSSTSNVDKQKAQEYPCVLDYIVKPINKHKIHDIFKAIEYKMIKK